MAVEEAGHTINSRLAKNWFQVGSDRNLSGQEIRLSVVVGTIEIRALAFEKVSLSR